MNRAIAESCGWTYHPFKGGWQSPTSSAPSRDQNPPDFLNDLNACHEMEKVLFPQDSSESVIAFGRYEVELSRLTSRRVPISAPASARCEAAIIALNLYQENRES